MRLCRRRLDVNRLATPQPRCDARDMSSQLESFTRYASALLPYRAGTADTEARLTLLQGVVFDLLIEIQALRAVVTDVPELRGRYAESYRKAALLSHNGAGVVPSFEKVIRQFIDVDHGGEGEHREEPMLRRLGVDVEEYRREAEYLSQLT